MAKGTQSLLGDSLGRTIRASVAGFFSKSVLPHSPLTQGAALEFLDSASEYCCLQQQVSNLWFPDNGSVFCYRTGLVCISIIRQGTGPGLSYPFAWWPRAILWSGHLPQPFRVENTGQGRRPSTIITEIKPKQNCTSCPEKGSSW